MSKAVILGAAHPHIYGIAGEARAVPGLNITGVYDRDETIRQEAAQKLGVPAFTTLEEALAGKPNVALIGAFPADRAELVARAADAGVAALVDKPLALTHEALDDLIARVTKAGTPLSVYYPYRGYPHVLAAREALAAGKIGQLVRVMSFGPHKLNAPTRPDWHWTRAGNGGALIDTGAHHFDLIAWVADAQPEFVTAMHANRSQPSHPEFQDIAQAQVRFANGVLGHVEVDWINPTAMKNFGDTRIWLAGTRGKIEIRLGDEQVIQLWNDQVSGERLDVSGYTAPNQWASNLIAELAAGRQGEIPLKDIWRASRLSLTAFDSAESNSQPLNVRQD